MDFELLFDDRARWLAGTDHWKRSAIVADDTSNNESNDAGNDAIDADRGFDSAPERGNAQPDAPTATGAADLDPGGDIEHPAGVRDEDEASPSPVAKLRLPALNRRIEGRLTLTYEKRTVSISCDGDTALRVLSMIAGSRDPRLRDHIDPYESSAYASWIVLDAHPLAAVWEPTFGCESDPGSDRIVVDPVPTGLRARLSRSEFAGTRG